MLLHRLQVEHRGGNSSASTINAITIPKKVHRPKVISQFKSEESYPDVDKGFFLHESFGKAIFQPKNWDASAREDYILYDKEKHKKALDKLSIGLTTASNIRSKFVSIVTAYWDLLTPKGIWRCILGYKFIIDTGASKGVCCRPHNCGHYEGSIIMDHIDIILNNK